MRSVLMVPSEALSPLKELRACDCDRYLRINGERDQLLQVQNWNEYYFDVLRVPS